METFPQKQSKDNCVREVARSKRKGAELFIQELSKKSNVKVYKQCQFFIVLTKANIELIWCEENPYQDAYTHPLYEHIQNRTQWMIRNRFIAVHSWRAKDNSGGVEFNATSNKVGQAPYPRRYYLRIVDDNESTNSTRRTILDECAKVRILFIILLQLHNTNNIQCTHIHLGNE